MGQRLSRAIAAAVALGFAAGSVRPRLIIRNARSR